MKLFPGFLRLIYCNKHSNFMKTFYIVRGLPSSGKSTVASNIVGVENNIAADDYFYMIGNGEYAWSEEKLHEAHTWCYKTIEDKMRNGEPLLAVSNTSVRDRDVRPYYELGTKWGYQIFVLTVEKWHIGQNNHNVPVDVLDKMEKRLKNSIKLR